MSKILLVDNEASILSVLSTVLKAEGYGVKACRDVATAQDILKKESFDLLITDIRMSPLSGLDLLKWTRNEYPDISVVMLTAYGSVETAIEAMKLGAFDYVTKPFKVAEMLIIIHRALEYGRAMTENVLLKDRLSTKYRFENIIAESPAMKNVCEMINRVAPTDTTVLIYGDSGTGKELVAKAIHSHSRRRNKKFLAINCAALPEPLLESEMFGHVKGAFTGAVVNKTGLFEAVEDGTLFLDEIGSISLNIQGKLLRVLQEKEVRRVGANETIPVNARVLAATNIKLEELIEAGKFREDLYYRLNIISINIAPLRERKEDILPLARHFLEREMGAGKPIPQIDPEVIRVLEEYPWPGNVREMENAIKHCLTFMHGDTVSLEVLPHRILTAMGDVALQPMDIGEADGFRVESLRAFLKRKESEYLEQVLTGVDGDKEKAASALKISLATLYRKLSKEEPPQNTEELEA